MVTEPIVVVKKRLTSFSIDAQRKSGLRSELSLSFMSQGEMAQTSLVYPPRGLKPKAGEKASDHCRFCADQFLFVRKTF